jgi:hypothetical protein
VPEVVKRDGRRSLIPESFRTAESEAALMCPIISRKKPAIAYWAAGAEELKSIRKYTVSIHKGLQRLTRRRDMTI